MNKDQIKGAIKDSAGKIQQEAGHLTGSQEHEAKGVGKQVEGTVQKGVGDLKQNISDALKKH